MRQGALFLEADVGAGRLARATVTALDECGMGVATSDGAPEVLMGEVLLGSEQAISFDASQGPTKVKTDGKMPMVKGAKYSRSCGDEAGGVGGVVSGVNVSECESMMYSFDVKFEGKNVCRMGDPLFHNKKNIMG